jgi:histidine triad (HIT) family protein
MADTLFERIIKREIPATFVHEDEQCVAIRDVNPQAPLHVLVIPRRSIPKLSAAESGDEALMGHCLRVAGEIALREGYADFRLIANNGEWAGQTVFHLHFHVLAGRSFRWPPG